MRISDNEPATRIKTNYTKVVAPSVDVSTGDVPHHYFRFESYVADTQRSKVLQEIYTNEFSEAQSEKKALSREDERFLEIMESGMSRNGPHYVLPLPFRNANIKLPNNKVAAEQRLRSLGRRLSRDKKLHEEYTQGIKKLIDKGYARIANISQDKEGKVWYIPHHAVHNPNKDKPRVAFDCSSKFKDRCLNNELIQGPDLTNSMVGVLLRFREEDVAVMADIEAMHLRVQVPEDQRSFLRFLWWPDGNLDTKPVSYEMCAHLFGATSSASCANFALKQAAKDGEKTFGTEAASALRKNFYADDLLKSVLGTENAKSLIKSVVSTCDAGAFNLTKIVSNDHEVVESLPTDKRAPSVRDISIASSAVIERALGILWHLHNDTLGFSITLSDLHKPRTKRALSSTVHSINDPLGLVSAFLLEGRRIVQDITKLKGS